MDEKPADLAQYGLRPPRIDVSFKVKGQAAEKRILLGDKTPTGGDLYAKLPDSPRVFLVSSFLESTFNKDPFSLRDKTILKVDRDKADGFEASAGTTTLEFAKNGSDWTIVKPIAARADFGAVEGAIERLASANMQGITADERHRSEAVRPRQAHRDDDGEVRQLMRHADAGQDRQRGGVRQGRVAADGLHRGAHACATT